MQPGGDRPCRAVRVRGPPRAPPQEAEDIAREEGARFAADHGLTIVATVTDPFGTTDPQAREGWQRGGGMAARSRIETVITRWPASIARDRAQETRCAEIARLQTYGVSVRYSWETSAEDHGVPRL